jgi:hypothetical protein
MSALRLVEEVESPTSSPSHAMRGPRMRPEADVGAALNGHASTFEIEEDEVVDGDVFVPSRTADASSSPVPVWVRHRATRRDSGMIPARTPDAILFDAADDLENARTVREAADICAVALTAALRARAVIVHQHHLSRAELVKIAVCGVRAHDLIDTCASATTDTIAAAVVSERRPFRTRLTERRPSMLGPRFAVVGASRSIVAVPVVAWDRCVAIIEVIDADERWEFLAAAAAVFLGTRFADVLRHRRGGTRA